MDENGEIQEIFQEQQSGSIPQHNTFEFKIEEQDGKEQQTIIFNSKFDSGNCGEVIQNSSFEYDIYTSADRDLGTEQEGYSKSWFYFSVKGFKMGQTLKLNIQRIHMLWSLWNSKACNHYKPVYKINQDGQYQKLQTEAQIQMVSKNCLVLSFEYIFDRENSELDEVFFSFSYPYEYKRCQEMIQNLKQQYANDKDIYFNSEVIAQSPQQRDVNLLTISSFNGIQEKYDDYISQSLFPKRECENRAKKFRSNKPYILITSRVHPGETPSSFALDGIIKFLLNKNDARACLLRHFFVFQIVPMLNPDGVYNGHYRMDIYNNNLNRFYKIADPQKQPSIYGIKKLVEYLQEDKKIFFYIDLHAHASKKGHFVYGNACSDLVMQIENQTFAKILSMNCTTFEYNQCNFSKKHMKARDKFEEMTKEGCGRVQVHQMTNIIHAYTLECGFHQANQLNIIPNASNTDFKLNDNLGFEYDPTEDLNSNIYKGKKDSPSFTIALYENVGKAILITILDIFDKNPYSRIPNSQFKNVDNIRRSIGWDCIRLERFRKDPLAYKKARKINKFIQEAFFSDFERRKVFSFDSKIFKNIQWPENLSGNFLKRYVCIHSPMQNNNQQQKKSNKYQQIKSRIFDKKMICSNNIDENNFDHKNGNEQNFPSKDSPNIEVASFPNLFLDNEKSHKNISQKNLYEIQNEENCKDENITIQSNSFIDDNNQIKNQSKSESPRKYIHQISSISQIPFAKGASEHVQSQISNDQEAIISLYGYQNQQLTSSVKSIQQIEEGEISYPIFNLTNQKKNEQEKYLSDVQKNNDILQKSLYSQFDGNQNQNIRYYKTNFQHQNSISRSAKDRTARQTRMSSFNGANESQQKELQSFIIQANDKLFYVGGEQTIFQNKNGFLLQNRYQDKLQAINNCQNSKKLLISYRNVNKKMLQDEMASQTTTTKESFLGSSYPSTSKLNYKRQSAGQHKNQLSTSQYAQMVYMSQIKKQNYGLNDDRFIYQPKNDYEQIKNIFQGRGQNTNTQMTSSSKSFLKANKNQNINQFTKNLPQNLLKRASSNQSNQSNSEEQSHIRIINITDTLNMIQCQSNSNIPYDSINKFKSTKYQTIQSQELASCLDEQQASNQLFKCFNIMEIPNTQYPGNTVTHMINTTYGAKGVQKQIQIKNNAFNKNSLLNPISNTISKVEQFYTQKPIIQQMNIKSHSQQPPQKIKNSPKMKMSRKRESELQKNNKLFDVIFNNAPKLKLNITNFNNAQGNYDKFSLNPDNEENQKEFMTKMVLNFPEKLKSGGVFKIDKKQQNGLVVHDEDLIHRSIQAQTIDGQDSKQINIFNETCSQKQKNDGLKLPNLKEGNKHIPNEQDQKHQNKVVFKPEYKSSKL